MPLLVWWSPTLSSTQVGGVAWSRVWILGRACACQPLRPGALCECGRHSLRLAVTAVPRCLSQPSHSASLAPPVSSLS